MRIAVNTRLLLPGKLEGIGWFSVEILRRMVARHPEHEFLFFFDRPWPAEFVFGPNVTPVALFPPARHPFLFVIWFEWALPRALKRYKADLLFSPDGFLSLRTRVPQVPVIHDINFEHYPKDLPWLVRHYYRFFFPRFARKASRILTVSGFSRNDIAATYGIPESKIAVAYNGLKSGFFVSDEPGREQICKEFTGGERYFLFVGSLHPRKNVHRLLQAYEKYRDSGGSIARIVIAGATYWMNPEMKQTWKHFNRKEEVVFTGHLLQGRLAALMSAAHALVFVPYFEGFGLPVIESFACRVPVLAANTSSIPEIAGDAALLVDPFDIEAIAAGMRRIASDVELREELKERGMRQLAKFDWDQSEEIIWRQLVESLKMQ